MVDCPRPPVLCGLPVYVLFCATEKYGSESSTRTYAGSAEQDFPLAVPSAGDRRFSLLWEDAARWSSEARERVWLKETTTHEKSFG